MSLSASDYIVLIKRMANLGLSGGVMYDALITRAAEKSGADKVLTFNLDDFKRVWPEGAARITVL